MDGRVYQTCHQLISQVTLTVVYTKDLDITRSLCCYLANKPSVRVRELENIILDAVDS